MKITFPDINEAISIKQNMINSFIIENPQLLYNFIADINKQLNKQDGKMILSVNNEIVEIHKSIHLITDVYGMDLNSKTIMTKIVDELSKKAVDEVYYEKTMQIISIVQNYVNDLVWDFDCEIECSEIVPKQIIKAMNLFVVDDAKELSDKILTYVELIRQFLGERLFVFVNFRGFIQQEKFELLGKTLIEHEYRVLFIDNKEYPIINNENRLTIDIDLCEF